MGAASILKTMDSPKFFKVRLTSLHPDRPLGFDLFITLNNRHVHYTYNHSLDVSVYSLGLAQKAGFTSKEDLMEMGRGSLFHDIGKRKVPVEIITKKGALDDNE